MKVTITKFILWCLAAGLANAKRCYVCTGVGTSESITSTSKGMGMGDSFFDLSEFEEARTAEKDESTLEMDMCNDLKTRLPESLLKTCPNPDDFCFIEKISGKMEAAIETLNEEDIVALTSTQISRGCKALADLPLNIEFQDGDSDQSIPLAEALENPRPTLLTEEICEQTNTRGLVGTKCLTICTQEGCNSAGRLQTALLTLIACIGIYLATS